MANILAAAATPATSTDVVLASGASANLAIMVASGSLPTNAEAIVYAATSGANVEVCRLTYAAPVRNLAGPGTFRVTRPGTGSVFGVDSLA